MVSRFAPHSRVITRHKSGRRGARIETRARVVSPVRWTPIIEEGISCAGQAVGWPLRTAQEVRQIPAVRHGQPIEKAEAVRQKECCTWRHTASPATRQDPGCSGGEFSRWSWPAGVLTGPAHSGIGCPTGAGQADAVVGGGQGEGVRRRGTDVSHGVVPPLTGRRMPPRDPARHRREGTSRTRRPAGTPCPRLPVRP